MNKTMSTMPFSAFIRKARVDAGITNLEEAGARINVCWRVQQEYETGKQIPPPAAVHAMGREFKNPLIPRIYCDQVCPIGKDCRACATDYKGVSATIISLQQRFKRLTPVVMDTLPEMGRNDFFDEEEIPALIQCVSELNELSKDVDRLRLHVSQRLEKEKATVAAAA